MRGAKIYQVTGILVWVALAASAAGVEDPVKASGIKADLCVHLGASDGKLTAELGGTCHASPVAADGHLVVGCDDGKLYAFRGK